MVVIFVVSGACFIYSFSGLFKTVFRGYHKRIENQMKGDLY